MTDPFIPTRALEERVEEWLRKIANDDTIFTLMRACVGRVILKRKIEDFEKLENLAYNARLWLSRNIGMKSAWLDNVGLHGYPKKLLKFSDIEGIEKEMRKSRIKEAQHFAQTISSSEDEEYFAEIGGGYHLVRLKTREALLREGAILQLCLGDGIYDELLAGGEFDYMILRDRHGRSHAAIEVRSDRQLVRQFRGKQNLVPKDRYLAPLVAFFVQRGWPIQNDWFNGVVIDDEGRIYKTEALPDRLSLRGNLNVESGFDVVLPRELVVTGLLHYRNCRISRYPDRVEAQSVRVEKCSGKAVALDLDILDYLDIAPDAVFETIADRLVVDGTVQLAHNRHIARMPRHLRVSDWLNASDTDFYEFGADTRISGCILSTGASVNGTFTLDADRTIVNVNDFVEVIAAPKGKMERVFGDFKGAVATLVESYGGDGGLFDIALDKITVQLALTSTCIRKLPLPTSKPRIFWNVEEQGDSFIVSVSPLAEARQGKLRDSPSSIDRTMDQKQGEAASEESELGDFIFDDLPWVGANAAGPDIQAPVD